MGFSSSPQTVIVHREVMGPSELISKKESFLKEGIILSKCDVSKTCFDGEEGDVGMFDDDIVVDGDPDPKTPNQRQLRTNQRASLIHSLNKLINN
jgi:hypothetical protein